MSSIRWLLLAAVAAPTVGIQDLPSLLLNRVRRFTNLSSMFGSQRNLAETPYERVAGHPVFQVTTPWGAPYMNFETAETEIDSDEIGKVDSPKDTRPVTLYYMDPTEALKVQQEMKQIPNMKKSDIRITTTSLAKAIRQSSNMGNGLPTGAAINPHSGRLPNINDGGSLRHKIVPSKRQMFYAARCVGRERVGLFGTSAERDAKTVAMGDLTAENAGRNLKNRRAARSALTPEEEKHKHMEGRMGIPVFYCSEIRKRNPLVKRIISGTKEEYPIFFSYEDLLEAWGNMLKRSGKKIPPQPSSVEVFNLMDILSSMDKEEWKARKGLRWRKPISSLKKTLLPEKSDFESLTFIPPNYCVQYKDIATAEGNGKARLRPMR